MKFISTVVLLSLALLAGCEAKQNPERVAILFWQAMGQYDVEGAKQLATKDSAARIMVQKTKNIENLEFADAIEYSNDDNSKAVLATGFDVISTELDEEPDETLSIKFNTSLVQEEGEWKVDFDRTLASMMKGTLIAVGDQLKDSILGAAESTIELSNEAMVTTMVDMTAALQEATRDMQKAALEMLESREQQQSDETVTSE